MYTDLLICCDEDFPYLYHSRKLICKLRQMYGKQNSWFFYKEYRSKECEEDEKFFNQASFLVNSLLFN